MVFRFWDCMNAKFVRPCRLIKMQHSKTANYIKCYYTPASDKSLIFWNFITVGFIFLSLIVSIFIQIMTAVSCQQELPRLIRRMPEGQPKEILSRLRGLTQRCVNSVHLDLIVIVKMFKSMSSPGSLIEKKDRIYEVLKTFLFTNEISSRLIILYLEIESRYKAWYNAFLGTIHRKWRPSKLPS